MTQKKHKLTHDGSPPQPLWRDWLYTSIWWYILDSQPALTIVIVIFFAIVSGVGVCMQPEFLA
jgi:hypothetical protein